MPPFCSIKKMKFNLFKKKDDINGIQAEWNTKGEQYAKEVNAMVEFGEKYGWENWKGKEPEDKRDHLADRVIELLREANFENKVNEFRQSFPPSHAPLIKYFEEKGQSIEQIHFIENEKIIFLLGTAYQKRQAFILNGEEVIKLDGAIDSIGKSKRGNVFAIQIGNKIVTTKGWQGELISEFEIKENKELRTNQLIPFNNGLKVLSLTSEGIYLMSREDEKMIHPVPDLEDEEWTSLISMENGAISNDNRYIVVGDQDSDHRVLDLNGTLIAEIGPQSSYPHFCLFSDDDSQLITNSCHFYNGITIGVDTISLNGLKVEAYAESDLYTVVDDGMRVYCGIAIDDYYILGDAFGYIKAIDMKGQLKWRHFLGSTIGGITISDNKEILWVASCTGMIHKLRLGKGHRDSHTIGNGNHFEDFRLIIWKNEPIMKW